MSTTKELIVIIRPSFMKFCQDGCRAAAFNHMLYWIAQKAKSQPQEKIQNGEITWYATTEEITEGLANAWGVCKVRQEVNKLIETGLIGRSKNPQWGADRTKHFSFGKEQCARFLALCQQHRICLFGLGLSQDVIHLINLSNPNDESIECICGNHQMQMIDLSNAHAQANDKSIRAITKDSKVTSKDSSKEDSAISPEVQLFFSLWIATPYGKSSKNLDEKKIKQCTELAPHAKTMEELLDWCDFALKQLPPNNNGKLWLANLINCREDWQQGKLQPAQEVTKPPIEQVRSKMSEICERYEVPSKEPRKRIKNLWIAHAETTPVEQFLAWMDEAGQAETIEQFFHELEIVIESPCLVEAV